MKESRRLKLIMSILFVVVLGITAGTLMIFNNHTKEAKKEADNVLGTTSVDLASVPYITSVAPIVGYVGEEYSYNVKYSDNDSLDKDISISLVSSPTWLQVEDRKVYGIPPVGSEGSYKFSVRIFDGVNSSVQDSYILIQDHEE